MHKPAYLQPELRFCVNFFFFFKAEDGIRDRDVIGVQTCALPISVSGLPEERGGSVLAGCPPAPSHPVPPAGHSRWEPSSRTPLQRSRGVPVSGHPRSAPASRRSEERRGGTEVRYERSWG